MNEQYKILELPKEDPEHVADMQRKYGGRKGALIMGGLSFAAIAAAGLNAEGPKSPDQAPTVATSTPAAERNAPAGFIDINDPNAAAIRIANGTVNSHEPGILSGEGMGASEANSIPNSVVNPGSAQLETVQVSPDTQPQG